jgi:3',5'-cyclic AMP phosphodiesterase CpdA
MRVLHVSDLHFGRPCRPEVIDATEAHIQEGGYDVVAISGDVAQRSLSGEFQRAAAFIREANRVSRVIIVPGNHDVAWWMSPLHIRGTAPMYERYRRYVSDTLEPILTTSDATFVGINTSHGVASYTVTTRPRDVSIIGAVQPAQLDRAERAFAAAHSSALRVVVMHHNPVRGKLSNRFGITRPAHVMQRFGEMGVDLVLCGHDHQEAVTQVTSATSPVVVCTAGTLSDRSRGGRPSSFFSIEVSPTQLTVTPHFWLDDARRLNPEPTQCFDRSLRT